MSINGEDGSSTNADSLRMSPTMSSRSIEIKSSPSSGVSGEPALKGTSKSSPKLKSPRNETLSVKIPMPFTAFHSQVNHSPSVAGAKISSRNVRNSLGIANVSVYGDETAEDAERRRCIDKYGTADLSNINLHWFTMSYLNVPDKRVLRPFDEYYLRINSSPDNTFSSWILLFLCFATLLCNDYFWSTRSTSQYAYLVYLKYFVIFPTIFGGGCYIRSKHYTNHSQVLGIAVIIIALALVADKVFVKKDTEFGLMTVLYVSLSFLPLQFKYTLLLDIIIFMGYILFHQVLLNVVLTREQAELIGNSPMGYVFANYMYQILFIVAVNIQAYISERSARKNFLQLQLMLQQQRKVVKEKKKNELLLQSMLPPEILRKMKNDEELIFEFSQVTIMFCQICEFSEIVKHLTPQNVVRLLNTVYSAFDKIIDANSVYKVETVSEVYMAVSGCPTKVTNHALLLASAALDMQAAMPSLRKKLSEQIGNIGVEELKIRIGLNTGPIVAGVIGKKNPRYKLFGDTVNTTSRMESTCEYGKIQCTSSTQVLLSNHFDVNYRGEISVKGKGTMKTYFVEDYKDGKKSVIVPEVIADDEDVYPSETDYLDTLESGTPPPRKDKRVLRRVSSGRIEMEMKFNEILKASHLPTPKAAPRKLGETRPGVGESKKSIPITGESKKNLRRATKIDHEFELPTEYRSFQRATFCLNRETTLEKIYLERHLKRWLQVIRMGIGLSALIVIGDTALGYVAPSSSFAGAGQATTQICDPKDPKVATLQLMKSIMQYGIVLPCALMSFLITIGPRLQAYNSTFFSVVIPLVALTAVGISLAGLQPNHGVLDLYIVAAFNLSNTPFLVRAITFLIIPFIYSLGIYFLCSGLLHSCVADGNNICFLRDENNQYQYSPFSTIFEYFIYNIVFTIGQVCRTWKRLNNELIWMKGYIVAQREYIQRVNTYRDELLIKQRKVLEEQENQVLELLKRMLPESVAYSLKNRAGVIANNFEEVSILFTDMKGFTAYSSTVTPYDLMRFLDRMFSTFDKIADEYGLYKVEIIGDAYFCVSGCPDPTPDHAVNMVKAGLALLKTIPTLQELAGTKFELRVGMHIGPVVGGVVGINNPRYHVFGDAVACANAMESSGQVGRLHCSEHVYKKLKFEPSLKFHSCGAEEIPGCGKMVTYFVEEAAEGILDCNSEPALLEKQK